MQFDVINEKREHKIGNIISVFKLPDVKEKIALFSIEGLDDDTASLEVAYLLENSEGYNYIAEITDDKVLKQAFEVVKEITSKLSI